jgi:5-methylcytosine-specific restriction endonuclease McrA
MGHIDVVDGLTVPVWGGRNARDALARVKSEGARTNEPCFLCQQRIDYALVYPHPYSCSVEHVLPRETFPLKTWDPANWKPAHLECNVSRRKRRPAPQELQDLGFASPEW